MKANIVEEPILAPRRIMLKKRGENKEAEGNGYNPVFRVPEGKVQNTPAV